MSSSVRAGGVEGEGGLLRAFDVGLGPGANELDAECWGLVEERLEHRVG